jgi:enoyl-CoA hydratase/carnithine racemase
MNYEALSLVLEPPIARLILQRPESGNEVDSRLLKELADAADRLGDEAGVRVLLIEAEGRDFCRGWSMDFIADRSQAGLFDADPFAALAGLSVPVVVALQGEVASAGLEMALTCDIRIAADNVRFSLPEVEQGRLPFGGATQRLPRAIGKGRAIAMIIAGEAFDADAAYRAGLVMKVVPLAALPGEAEALTSRVASRGPIALKYAKEAVNRGLDMTLDQALGYENDLTVILQTTEDRTEGVRAFREGRRRPRFEGR